MWTKVFMSFLFQGSRTKDLEVLGISRIKAMLIRLKEIIDRLNDEFLKLESTGVTGLRLVANSEDRNKIDIVEGKLVEKFHPSFRSLIEKYDFGNFTIGPIAFGFNSAYLE